MRRENTVTAYVLGSTRATRVNDDAFTFQPARGWVWAQRAAIWVLRKLGCHQRVELEVWHRNSLDNDPIVVALERQHMLLRERRLEDGAVIYMGPDTFTKFAGEMGPSVVRDHLYRQVFELDAGAMRSSRERPEGWFQSVPIIVLPWMEGYVFAPARTAAVPVRVRDIEWEMDRMMRRDSYPDVGGPLMRPFGGLGDPLGRL